MIYYIGILQGISSGLLIFAYIINRGGLITKARWREYVKINKTIYKPFDNEERLDIHEMSIEMTHLILMTKVFLNLIMIYRALKHLNSILVKKHNSEMPLPVLSISCSTSGSLSKMVPSSTTCYTS